MKVTIINSFKEFEDRIFKKLVEIKSFNLDGQILVVSCQASNYISFPCDALAMEKEYHAIASSCRALAKEIRKLYQKASEALKEERQTLEEKVLADLLPIEVDLFNKEREIFSSREYLEEKDYGLYKKVEVDSMIIIRVDFYRLPKLKILY